MLRILLFTLLAATLQSDSQSRVLIKAPPPQEEVLDGYNRGHCISLPHQMRVCKQVSDDRDIFLVEKSGKQVGVWAATSAMGETGDFEVLRADLEHDGRAELIVANRDGTSQGLGINYWTISIFHNSAFPTVAEPLTFSVEEYGSFGTFVVDDHFFVNIFTTRWVWTTDPKGKRGEGLYLAGQWWRYRAGELVPQVKRAPIARRYLFSFEKERWDTVDSDQVPYRWFRNAKAEKLKPEQITGPSSKSETGIIENVSVLTNTRSERTVKITFRGNGGAPVAYSYPRGDDGDNNTDLDLDFIGDAATGRIYPIRYLPATIDSWLKRKRATLRTYGDEPRTEKILWLER